MDQPIEMRVFARVAELQSFSAAAKDFGLTPSAVSKLVSRLEDRLGVQLLHRTTRRLALTPEGEIYHRGVSGILAAIDDVELELASSGQAPRGRLRLTCVVTFALHELAAALPDFLARYPGVEIELTATDRVVDLIAEHADVGIRTGTVNDPSLIVRKICTIHRGLYASPSYLARRGTPASPGDLADHDCIVVNGMRRWPFRESGKAVIIEPASRLLVFDGESALQMALGGVGIVRVSDMLAGSAVRAGRLVPLLTDIHVVDSIPLSAVYPQGRHRMPKVRAFLDFLMERFSHAPWRQAVMAEPLAAAGRRHLNVPPITPPRRRRAKS